MRSKKVLPFIPIDGEKAFASFVVIGDTEMVNACAPVLAERIGAVDAVVYSQRFRTFDYDIRRTEFIS